jgi:hypothetical protein
MEEKEVKNDNKTIKRDRTFVEFLNDIVDKVQVFTDDKLDKLEEKFNKYTID